MTSPLMNACVRLTAVAIMATATLASSGGCRESMLIAATRVGAQSAAGESRGQLTDLVTSGGSANGGTVLSSGGNTQCANNASAYGSWGAQSPARSQQSGPATPSWAGTSMGW